MHDWNDAEGLVMQAGASFAAGRYADAESALRRALDLVPDEPGWLFNLGLTLEMLDRPLDAAVAFARSFRHADAESRLADLDSADDGYLPGLDEPDDDDPESPLRPPLAAVRVGANLLSLGQPRRAARWFRRAVRLDRTLGEAHTGLIAALGEMGRPSDAQTAFFEAQQDVETDARIYVAIAGILMTTGEHDRAIWCLREASRLDPALPHVRRNLATIFARTNRFERARQLYLAELRRDPGDTTTLLELGQLLVKMNRPEEAGEKFGRVLELVPDHPAGHYALACLAETLGDTQGAIRGFEVLTRLDPDHADARRRLAGLLLKRQNPKDLAAARDLLRRERAALRRRPTSPDDLHTLAVLMIKADMCGEAVPVLNAVLALIEHEAEARHAGHQTGHQTGHHAGLHAGRDRPEPGPHNARTALVYHHRAVALFESGDLRDALDSARVAVRLDPRLTPAMHNLALGHMRLGQWDRARHWTRRARAIDPDDPTIARLRVRLRLRFLIHLWNGLGRLTGRKARNQKGSPA